MSKKTAIIIASVIALMTIHNILIPPHLWAYFYDIEGFYFTAMELLFDVEEPEPFQKIT